MMAKDKYNPEAYPHDQKSAEIVSREALAKKDAEIERLRADNALLREALLHADKEAAKVEALLIPAIEWEDLKPTRDDGEGEGDA